MTKRTASLLMVSALVAFLTVADGGLALTATTGAHLTQDVTTTDPASGGFLAVDDTTPFDPAGGVAVIEPTSAGEETVQYGGVEGADRLVGIERSNPQQHAAGSFIEPRENPEATYSPAPDTAATAIPSGPTTSPSPSESAADSGVTSMSLTEPSTSSFAAAQEETLEVDPVCDATPEFCALELSVTPTSISGTFGYGASLVTFEAHPVSRTEATTNVTVNAVTFEASVDLERELAVWTAHDQALFVAEREALVALTYELERALVSSRDYLMPHEHVLYSGVSLWSEAPLGLPLSTQTVGTPVRVIDDLAAPIELGVPVVEDCTETNTTTSANHPLDGVDPLDPITDVLYPPTSGTTVGEANTGTVDSATESDGSTDVNGSTVSGSCQRADDDGIRYWTNCSSSAQTDIYHDATGSHCFLVQTNRNVGPCTNNCKGRCGPGCGWVGPMGHTRATAASMISVAVSTEAALIHGTLNAGMNISTLMTIGGLPNEHATAVTIRR
ncbi:MAG: hypothetical protein M3323_08565 [Actinomycetota bacterium]|nr:hypothetical protein [Actinomycetota bacterium]